MILSRLLAVQARQTLLDELAPLLAGFAAMLAGLVVRKGLGKQDALGGSTLGGVGFGVFPGVMGIVRGASRRRRCSRSWPASPPDLEAEYFGRIRTFLR